MTPLAGRREVAPAKINLALHVTGRRPDGYHELDSLVTFAGVGDVLEAEPAAGLSLSITGPFADGLEAGPGNLVIRAAELIRPEGRGAALRLAKRLPVAAGIGGGSADAAAALRLLGRLWGVEPPLPERLVALGADVPVCLLGQAARMRGAGERLQPIALPPFWLVLANPRVPLPTGAVFAGLGHRDNPGLPPIPASFADAAAVAAWLRATRNDLEAPARAIAPLVDAVLAALGAQGGCLLARMSGSGATCFGLFAGEAQALAAADALCRSEPGWWGAAGPGL